MTRRALYRRSTASRRFRLAPTDLTPCLGSRPCRRPAPRGAPAAPGKWQNVMRHSFGPLATKLVDHPFAHAGVSRPAGSAIPRVGHASSLEYGHRRLHLLGEGGEPAFFTISWVPFLLSQLQTRTPGIGSLLRDLFLDLAQLRRYGGHLFEVPLRKAVKLT